MFLHYYKVINAQWQAKLGLPFFDAPCTTCMSAYSRKTVNSKISRKLKKTYVSQFFSNTLQKCAFAHFVVLTQIFLVSVPPPCKTMDPCVHGVCVDVSSVEYKCKCDLGWIGKNCTGIV